MADDRYITRATRVRVREGLNLQVESHNQRVMVA
jgi:hypothetical protein